jgi:hypothetical protein
LAQDYPPGYVLNETKTIRAEGVAEINSTAFLKVGGGRWKEVVHLRRGGATRDLTGFRHIAKACVDAGTKWVDAFIKARVTSGWGILPSQLGLLDTQSYYAFSKQRRMATQYHTALPEPPKGEGSSLLVIGGPPTGETNEAVRSHVWSHGRDGGMKRDTWTANKGQVLKCRGLLREAPRSMRTYLAHLAGLQLARREKRETHCEPPGFVSIVEEYRVGLLRHWADAVRQASTLE